MVARGKTASRVAAVTIELGHSSLNVVICRTGWPAQAAARGWRAKVRSDESKHDSRPAHRESVDCVSMPWRLNSSGLHSTSGIAELTATLEKLVTDQNLSGCEATVLLDGERSVTQRVAGSEKEVEAQLTELEARCSRYLLLGHGRKVASRCARRQVDGVHVGLLSVANQRTLLAVRAACDRAGIKLRSITTSSLALTALIGAALPEGNRSGVLVRQRETGFDAAVIDQGQLLLEFHPVNKLGIEQIISALYDRSELLQRFFSRHASDRTRPLESVFLIADEASTQRFSTELRESQYTIHSVEDAVADAEWPIVGSSPVSSHLAAIGGSLGGFADTIRSDPPNLLSSVGTAEASPNWVLLARSVWPLAVAAVIFVATTLAAHCERNWLEEQRESVSRFRQLNDDCRALTTEVLDAGARLEQLKRLKRQLHAHEVSELLTGLAGCLADGAALEQFSLAADGALALHGSCRREEDVFRFVESIGRLSMTENSALRGTSPMGNGGEEVEFHAKAQLTAFREAAP